MVRSGARCATRTLVVHVADLGPNDAAADADRAHPARAGFVVGRSVGGAVLRNRVVRRLRHLMAAELAGIPDGLGIVVRALPPSAGASSSELAADLTKAVRRCVSRQVGQRPGTARRGSR